MFGRLMNLHIKASRKHGAKRTFCSFRFLEALRHRMDALRYAGREVCPYHKKYESCMPCDRHSAWPPSLRWLHLVCVSEGHPSILMLTQHYIFANERWFTIAQLCCHEPVCWVEEQLLL